jgi:hypothetical protein
MVENPWFRQTLQLPFSGWLYTGYQLSLYWLVFWQPYVGYRMERAFNVLELFGGAGQYKLGW